MAKRDFILPELRYLKLRYYKRGPESPFDLQQTVSVVGPSVTTLSILAFGGLEAHIRAAEMLRTLSGIYLESKTLFSNVAALDHQEMTEYLSGGSHNKIILQSRLPVTKTLLSALCHQPLQSLVLIGPPSQPDFSDSKTAFVSDICPTMERMVAPAYVYIALDSLPICPFQGSLEILHLTIATDDRVSFQQIPKVFQGVGECRSLRVLSVKSTETFVYGEDGGRTEHFRGSGLPFCATPQLLGLDRLENLTIALDGRLVRPPSNKDVKAMALKWPNLTKLRWSCQGAPYDLGQNLSYALPRLSALCHLTKCPRLREISIPIEVSHSWPTRMRFREGLRLRINGFDSVFYRRSVKSLKMFLEATMPQEATMLEDWVDVPYRPGVWKAFCQVNWI